jgi:hypothetical protein
VLSFVAACNFGYAIICVVLSIGDVLDVSNVILFDIQCVNNMSDVAKSLLAIW